MFMKYIGRIFTALFLLNTTVPLNAQVKIKDGTLPGSSSQPHNSASLELESANKGVLFPRLSSAQRNAIVNPADGLHIYNKDEKCLNYYDSVFSTWNCYCVTDTCRSVTITLSSGCGVDFYNSYAAGQPAARKYVVLIPPGVTITGCSTASAALSFLNLPGNASIKIINYGSILGAGGNGGKGASSQSTSPCSFVNGTAGSPGGDAIASKPGLTITVKNYGLIAGGGGGGGGGGAVNGPPYPCGGGGGGGAGSGGGTGGPGGGTHTVIVIGCSQVSSLAAPGFNGTVATAGMGGAGFNGGSAGGSGGGLAMPGAPGTPTGTAGGAAGKAINGGGGNSIQNVSGGQSFGAVD